MHIFLASMKAAKSFKDYICCSVHDCKFNAFHSSILIRLQCHSIYSRFLLYEDKFVHFVSN